MGRQVPSEGREERAEPGLNRVGVRAVRRGWPLEFGVACASGRVLARRPSARRCRPRLPRYRRWTGSCLRSRILSRLTEAPVSVSGE
jgi:hypothetical protein